MYVCMYIYTQIANKHIRRFSTSAVMKEMQIITISIYTRMAIKRKTVGKQVRKFGTLEL